MSANASGNIYSRQGSAEIVHTFVVNYNTTGIGTYVQLATMKATTEKPTHLEVSAVVVTAFNAGTTNVLTVGNSNDSTNEYLAAADITEGTPGYYPASNAAFKVRITSDTPIFVMYTQTGTAATTGQAIIIVKEFQENRKPIA